MYFAIILQGKADFKLKLLHICLTIKLHDFSKSAMIVFLMNPLLVSHHTFFSDTKRIIFMLYCGRVVEVLDPKSIGMGFDPGSADHV